MKRKYVEDTVRYTNREEDSCGNSSSSVVSKSTVSSSSSSSSHRRRRKKRKHKKDKKNKSKPRNTHEKIQEKRRELFVKRWIEDCIEAITENKPSWFTKNVEPACEVTVQRLASIRGRKQNNVLHMAVNSDGLDVLEALLRLGGDTLRKALRDVNSEGQTPIALAYTNRKFLMSYVMITAREELQKKSFAKMNIDTDEYYSYLDDNDNDNDNGCENGTCDVDSISAEEFGRMHRMRIDKEVHEWSSERDARKQRKTKSKPASKGDKAGEPQLSHIEVFTAFKNNPPRCIVFEDMPWPVLTSSGKFPLPGKVVRTPSLLLHYKRQLFSMWHPDKIQQRFGSLLHPDHREAVIKRVTELAQKINEM